MKLISLVAVLILFKIDYSSGGNNDGPRNSGSSIAFAYGGDLLHRIANSAKQAAEAMRAHARNLAKMSQLHREHQRWNANSQTDNAVNQSSDANVKYEPKTTTEHDTKMSDQNQLLLENGPVNDGFGSKSMNDGSIKSAKITRPIPRTVPSSSVFQRKSPMKYRNRKHRNSSNNNADKEYVGQQMSSGQNKVDQLSRPETIASLIPIEIVNPQKLIANTAYVSNELVSNTDTEIPNARNSSAENVSIAQTQSNGGMSISQICHRNESAENNAEHVEQHAANQTDSHAEHNSDHIVEEPESNTNNAASTTSDNADHDVDDRVGDVIIESAENTTAGNVGHNAEHQAENTVAAHAVHNMTEHVAHEAETITDDRFGHNGAEHDEHQVENTIADLAPHNVTEHTVQEAENTNADHAKHNITEHVQQQANSDSEHNVGSNAEHHSGLDEIKSENENPIESETTGNATFTEADGKATPTVIEYENSSNGSPTSNTIMEHEHEHASNAQNLSENQNDVSIAQIHFEPIALENGNAQKTAPGCEMLKNLQIAGKSLDNFFNLTSCDRERELQESITATYMMGAQQRSAVYIMTKNENLLSMVYCTIQKELRAVLHAIEEEKLNHPEAVDDYEAILSNIRKIAANGKRRLDYFLQIWKQMIKTILGAVRRPTKLISVSAPFLKQRAPENGKKLSQMIFSDIRILREAVHNTTIKIAEMNLKQMKAKAA